MPRLFSFFLFFFLSIMSDCHAFSATYKTIFFFSFFSSFHRRLSEESSDVKESKSWLIVRGGSVTSLTDHQLVGKLFFLAFFQESDERESICCNLKLKKMVSYIIDLLFTCKFYFWFLVRNNRWVSTCELRDIDTWES